MHRAFKVGLLALAALLPVLTGACSLDNSGGQTVIEVRDVDRFVLNEFSGPVMSVLLRDCGFQACHGSPERFFRVWGPGRTRFDTSKTECENHSAPPCPWDILDAFERDYSLRFARSMIDLAKPEDSLLLRKPLAVERGGADHEGVDKYGRNVYRTQDDDGFRTLARWVFAYAEAQKLAGQAAAVTPSAATP